MKEDSLREWRVKVALIVAKTDTTPEDLFKKAFAKLRSYFPEKITEGIDHYMLVYQNLQMAKKLPDNLAVFTLPASKENSGKDYLMIVRYVVKKSLLDPDKNNL